MGKNIVLLPWLRETLSVATVWRWDYYMGAELLCLACESEFYLPVGASPRPKDWQNKQRLAVLRADD